MKFKFNPITGVFDRISDTGELKEHINPLTGEFNLAPDADSYKQVFNPLTGKRNLALAAFIAEVMGNGYINLTNAVKNKLLELKAYGGTEQRNLPAGYTQVEYLQSSGTQYINTGIVPKTTLSVKIKYNAIQLTSGNNIAIFGSISNQTGLFSGVAGNPLIYYINSGASHSSLPNIPFALDTVFEEEYRNDSSMIRSGTTYSTNPIVENDVPIALFGRNTGEEIARIGTLRIYYFTLYDNGVLIQNLIPAKRKSDNVLGMYDTVSGKFLTNSGTGTFTAGADVTTPSPEYPMNIVCNNGVIKVNKNLFDYRYFYDNYQTYSASSVGRCPIKLKPNTEYTVSTNKNSIENNSVMFVVSGNAIDWTPNTANNGVLIESPRTVTTDSNGYLCFGLYIRSEREVHESDFENGTVWVQIEQGSTATPYAPYFPNGIYADGTVETIEVRGKNLFDAQWRQGLYDTGNGRYNPASNNRICNVNMIPIIPSTSYTVSCPSYSLAAGMRWLFYDSNKKFISANTQGPTTIITPSNARYINFYIANNLTVDTAPDLQLEKGAATTYEPYYNGGTATAEMLLKIGDYKDEQSILDGAIIRNVGIKVLDGTEAWTKSGQGTAQDPIRFAVAGLISFPDSDTIECLSTHYPFSGVASTGGSITPGTFNVGIYNNVHYVRFAPTDITELTQWIQYITGQYNAGTPVIIVYPLATPTTESVAGQEMNIQKGNNVIEITQASIDDLPLSAKYLSI